MNAVALDDKYRLRSGRIYVTGSQALVRLPIEQAWRDAAAGHNTAGFISGYRGSPLGLYDNALWQAEAHLRAHRIHFEPGVNEDLAAAAVWGTQQLGLLKGARHDGVFGLWYGKGPGVDRSTDVLKHGNFAGTSRLGGVLALAGDDHAARSSTVAHQSDHAFIHCGMPVLNPADIQDYVDLGLHGYALSRFSANWIGFKCVTDIVDGSASILVGSDRVSPVLPTDYAPPPGGLWIRSEIAALAQEARLFEERHRAAQAYVRINHLDHILIGGVGHKRLGIVTTGKGCSDVGEALRKLGIDAREAERLGIALFKIAMVWPLEPERIRSFAASCDEVLVIEEKRGLIEEQLAHLLYNLPATTRPRLVGKRDQDGRPLVSEIGELNPDEVMRAIIARYDTIVGKSELGSRIAVRPDGGAKPASKALAIRPPSFCAGCPHSTSTVVPEGSLAVAGIGCHGMASLMPERNTMAGSHMGGEGAPWIGQAPFTDIAHIFQNIGDGTYFHSGLLAIRACVAAKVNITYKILLNGAVGMTGGQPIEGEQFAGEITAPRVAHQVASEGVGRICVVSDDENRFAGQQDHFPVGTSLHHRDSLDAVQRELRDWKGVSVLIYDQSCATERRRLRKRGKMALATERLLIASEVCEGCGDCGAQSGCIAIEPLDTGMGTKRQINQSVCNQDYSCLKGFCPSFITVTGGMPRTRIGSMDDIEAIIAALPQPEVTEASKGYDMLVTGIGGAGVVTIGAVLGMAAHIEGRGCSVLDMSGFAQRNGSVMSHIRLASRDAMARSARIPMGGVSLVLGCDPVVTAGSESLGLMAPNAAVILNRFIAPTSAFAIDPDFRIDNSPLERGIVQQVGIKGLIPIDATRIATSLLGDAIGANLLLVGNAWQRGLIPLALHSIETAIRLNGVAVAMNLRALSLGRLTAAEPHRIEAMLRVAEGVRTVPPATLDALVDARARHLTAYQDERLATDYRGLVERVRAAEAMLGRDEHPLAMIIADVYARLLAYKDEYEVARLLTGPVLRQQLAEAFDGKTQIRVNLAPPFLSSRDPVTGRLRKRSFGPWILPMMRLLARLKGLRGTRFDPFGWSAHRRMERALAEDFRAQIEGLLPRLSLANHREAVELAAIYGTIRGYDVVKETSVEKAKTRLSAARRAFEARAFEMSRHNATLIAR